MPGMVNVFFWGEYKDLPLPCASTLDYYRELISFIQSNNLTEVVNSYNEGKVFNIQHDDAVSEINGNVTENISLYQVLEGKNRDKMCYTTSLLQWDTEKIATNTDTIIPSTLPTSSSIEALIPTIQTTENLIVGEPEEFILVLSDLRSNYFVDESNSGQLSNYVIAADSADPNAKLQELEKTGRVNGYIAGFFNNDINPVYISSNTIKMNSIENAQKYFDYGLTKNPNYIKIDVPIFGDDSAGQFWRRRII